MKSAHPAGELSHARWSKSSRSTSNSHCVEVAVADQVVGVRDTKDRDGGTLAFDRNVWSAFTASLGAEGFVHRPSA